MIEEESIGECIRSSKIFHSIPSPNFSALWNSACLSVLALRLSSAILALLQLIIPCSSSPRCRLRRLPSKFGLERLNLPMSLNPFPHALLSLASCSYAMAILEMLTSRRKCLCSLKILVYDRWNMKTKHLAVQVHSKD
jgi:hypothetical protein